MADQKLKSNRSFLEDLEKLQELNQKSRFALSLFFVVGIVMIVSGSLWMFLAWRNDPDSIKITNLFPILLITQGISFLWQVYKDI